MIIEESIRFLFVIMIISNFPIFNNFDERKMFNKILPMKIGTKLCRCLISKKLFNIMKAAESSPICIYVHEYVEILRDTCSQKVVTVKIVKQ